MIVPTVPPLPSSVSDTGAEKAYTEINLSPGEFYFGDRFTRIRTLLGSCVAVTFWHPDSGHGGMCHFMLPSRPIKSPLCVGRVHARFDGRYGDEVLPWLADAVRCHGVNPRDCQIKVFGGGNMFPTLHWHSDRMGQRNGEFALEWLKRRHLMVTAADLGGTGHRAVIFDLWSGHVWSKFIDVETERESESYSPPGKNGAQSLNGHTLKASG